MCKSCPSNYGGGRSLALNRNFRLHVCLRRAWLALQFAMQAAGARVRHLAINLRIRYTISVIIGIGWVVCIRVGGRYVFPEWSSARATVGGFATRASVNSALRWFCCSASRRSAAYVERKAFCQAFYQVKSIGRALLFGLLVGLVIRGWRSLCQFCRRF